MPTIVTGFDLETTGLDPKDHRIIEICLMPFDLDTGRKLGSYTARFNPGRSIDPKAQEVHKISFSDVQHEPLLESAPDRIAKIQKILAASHAVVAHNGIGFDKPFIETEFARIGQPLPEMRMVDTMLQGRWATHTGKFPNLGELCFAMREPYDPDQAHAAEYDTEKMMSCFMRGFQQGFFTIP
jgi:DNA polymerase-3 subunit epsilon